MTGRDSSFRVLLALTLLAPTGARSQNAPAGGQDPVAVKPEKPPLAEQIKKACDSPAIEMRLDDAENGERSKDAQKIAKDLGSGAAGEADEKGVTLSFKRGKSSNKDCRAKLARVGARYPGRVSFEPTTAERVDELVKRRDALLPPAMRKDGGDASDQATFFDGSSMFWGLFTQEPETVTPEFAIPLARRDNDGADRNWSYDPRPLNQRPLNFTTNPTTTPPPPRYAPVTFSQTVVNAYNRGSAYVSEQLSAAGDWISETADSVRNKFFSGVQMASGLGYKMVKAYRDSNWGTKPLVDGLKRVFAYMKGTGAATTDVAVGDISSRKGGTLYRHKSHKRGRDVDIGFYMTDQKGAPVAADDFVHFASGQDGLSGRYDGRTVRFDAPRNWMLIKAILANPEPGFEPTNIFIATHLEKAVLAAAPKDDPDRKRAAEMMTYEPYHENHLHLRVE